MPDLSPDQHVKVGGRRARDNGSFHLSFRSGSRATGTCASRAFDYIARQGRFEGADLDPAVYVESGHMPFWAEATSGSTGTLPIFANARTAGCSSVAISRSRADSTSPTRSTSRAL